MMHKNYFLAAAALFLSLPMWAQPLSLQRVVDNGLKNSKTLTADKSKIDAALAKYQATYATAYPSVNLTGSYMRQSYVEPFALQSRDPATGQPLTIRLGQPIENVTQARASVQQIIYAGGRTKYAIESAKLLTEASRLDVDKDRSEVQMNLINAFYNIYKLQMTQTILNENKKVADRRVIDVKNMAGSGMALQNDALRSELQVEQIAQSALELNNMKAAALYALGLQLGENFDQNTLIDTTTVWTTASAQLVRTSAAKPLQGYIEAGVANRIDLKATQTRLKTAENGVSIAKGAVLPTVSVGASYLYANPNQRYFPLEDKFRGSWDANITLAFNLTNAFTNKYSVNEAAANLMAQKTLADAQTDGIRTEIAAAYYNLQSAIAKIETNNKSFAQAKENYRVTNNKYTQQTATISELLDADALLLQTKINITTAEADAENFYYKLLKTIGGF